MANGNGLTHWALGVFAALIVSTAGAAGWCINDNSKVIARMQGRDAAIHVRFDEMQADIRELTSRLDRFLERSEK